MANMLAGNDETPEVWILAHVPPPINGTTLLTEVIVNAIQRVGPITFHNWSPGSRLINLRTKATRSLRLYYSLFRLIWNGRVRNTSLYTMSNAGPGLITTVIIVWVARRLGYRVYLQHHVYYYIDAHSRWMAMIDRCMGSSGTHVVHCDKMADDFRRQYASKSKFFVLHPSIVAIDVGQPREGANRPFRLGMLSNLRYAKGIDLTVDTFRMLYDQGFPVSLKLAGPVFWREANECVRKVLNDYPDAVEYVGPVYDQDKEEFLQSIDCLLFPSRSESWGIVIHEALSAGVPVISTRRGCTATVVGNEAGIVVPPCVDYVQAASEQIQRWMSHPEEYLAASRAAVDQANRLHRQASDQLEQFVAEVWGLPQSAVVPCRPTVVAGNSAAEC